jgi:putative Mn2+ efflux pump MntP
LFNRETEDSIRAVNFWTIFFVGVALSMDALAISMAIGTATKHKSGLDDTPD